MRFPISLLPAFCLGIISAFPLREPLSFWLLGLAFILSLFACRFYHPHFKHLCFFILGLSYSIFRIELALDNRLPLAQNKQPYTLQIIVQDIPRQEPYATIFTAHVINPPKGVPKKISFVDYKKNDWPSGSIWQVNARLKTPVGQINQTGFNKEIYYLSKAIGATGNIQKDRHYLGTSHTPQAYLDRFRSNLAQRIRAVGKDYPRGASLISALTIGEQNAIEQADWHAFRQTGITHLVSISGLHVTMVSLFAGFILRYLAFHFNIRRIQPRTIMLVGGICVALLYALLAGFSIPTQRSVFMLATIAILMLSQRYFSAWQIWWIALSIILLISPLALLSIGFWLSFSLVAALLYVVSNRKNLPKNKWLIALKAQLAVNLASIPPLSIFFGQFPIISPLVNSIAIPWVSWIITPFALISLILPFDAPLKWACILSEYSLATLDLILPFAYEYTIAKPPLLLLILSVIATLLLIAPRGFPMKTLGATSLGLLLLYQPPQPNLNEAHITVFDVGQGSSMLVQTQNHTLLFDTGLGDANWTILPNLRASGVKNLDKLILSHNDADHDSGFEQITQAYPNAIIHAGQPEAYMTQKEIASCKHNEKWQWDGVTFQWLTLPVFSKDSNNRSCVLKISTQNHSLLITGDLSKKGEEKLINENSDILNSDVFILGHHGSKSSNSLDFLQTIKPKYAISSSGFGNNFKHPHPDIIKRLEEQNITLLRTDLYGAIQIEIGQQLHVKPQVNHKPFWQIKPFPL